MNDPDPADDRFVDEGDDEALAIIEVLNPADSVNDEQTDEDEE